jgi:hypothetical protein
MLEAIYSANLDPCDNIAEAVAGDVCQDCT